MIYSKNNPHEMLKLISDYGFTSFRDGISWNATEKSSGVMGVTGLSQRLDDIYMGEKTLIVNNSMFILAYGNHNYTNNGRPQIESKLMHLLTMQNGLQIDTKVE
jgi:hypothetical protein